MNKYIVLSAVALVISLTIGCQNCGYRTAHCSRYETLVGKTRLASPQTNCRYNTCNAYNTCNTSCNPCNPCNTQLLANNSQLYSNAYAQDASQSGWYQSYAGQNPSAEVSLLDGTQQQTAQSDAPLRWRRVTEEEQQYANSAVNPTSAGVASALSAPAFGSPAPAPNMAPQYPTSRRAARGVASALETPDYPAAPQYPGQYAGQYAGQYPPRYPNSSPRAARGVASALDTPGYPAAPQYPGQYAGQYAAGQYPNTSPRATRGVDSALSVPNHPLPRQYSNQYPNGTPRVASGVNPSYGSPSYGAPAAGTGEEPLRWRRVTEEEQQRQQYYNAVPDSPMGADSSLAVPVYPNNNAAYQGNTGAYQGNNAAYQENSADPSLTPDYPAAPSVPEIDPNALPSLNSESGTF